jgi:hypothetical protein
VPGFNVADGYRQVKHPPSSSEKESNLVFSPFAPSQMRFFVDLNASRVLMELSSLKESA